MENKRYKNVKEWKQDTPENQQNFLKIMVNECAKNADIGYGKKMVNSEYLRKMADNMRKYSDNYISSGWIAMTELSDNTDILGMVIATSNSYQKWYRMEKGHCQTIQTVQFNTEYVDGNEWMENSENMACIRDCIERVFEQLEFSENDRIYIINRLYGESIDTSLRMANITKGHADYIFRTFRQFFIKEWNK